MDKSFTPEERLLKLIKEGGKADTQAKPDIHTKEVKEPSQPQIQRVSVFANLDLKNFFTTANIGRLLLFVFAGLFLYTLYDLSVFVVPHFVDISTGKNINVANQVKDSAGPAEKTEVKNTQPQPLNFYTQDIEKRNLFESTIIKDSAIANKTQPQPDKVKLEEIAKTLILKGVIAGQPTQAVIEDTKTQKTYFVTKGENIGDVTIDQISDDRVKIKLNDQTADLML